MSPSDRDKISWEDLNDQRVDDRLREQQAVGSTAKHFETAAVSVPTVAPASFWRRALRHAFVYLPLVGVAAGTVGWAVGEQVNTRPNYVAEAARLQTELDRIDRAAEIGRIDALEAIRVRDRIRAIGRDNPFFVATPSPSVRTTGTDSEAVETTEDASDSATATAPTTNHNTTTAPATTQSMTGAQRSPQRLSEPAGTLVEEAGLQVAATEGRSGSDEGRAARWATIERATFRADLITLCAIGLTLGGALAAADSMTSGRWRAALGEAIAGAAIGLAGAAGVTLVLKLAGVGSIADADTLAAFLPRLAGWAAIGLSVGVASGVASRQVRRTLAGGLGGLFGGAVAGALFALVGTETGEVRYARLAAAIAIGVAGGAAIALIERIVRVGWLRVIEGPIAGKQFILYRNPTLIGSAPTSHVYLFRDAGVGKRHAAIFEVEGQYEIENLPLGGPTLVNDRPVRRERLRHGDSVRVGRTLFAFEERRR